MKLSSKTPLATVVALVVAAGAVLAPASPSAATGGSHHARAGSKYVATLKISKTESMVDAPITLSGTVKPVARGITVKIQKKLEGKGIWKDEKVVTTNAAGKFSYTDKPSTPGKRQYRAVVPETKAHAKGISKTVSLLLYEWLPLANVEVRSRASTYSQNAIDIDGTTYGSGLAGLTYTNSGAIDWNFSRRCTELRGRFGNGDDSDITATASVELDLDGDAGYTGTFALGDSVFKHIDVTDAFRVGFSWTSTNSAGTVEDQSGAQAVLAEAEVRCSF